MAPMHEGKVVKPEVFNALPETMRKDVEAKIEALQTELASILERMPKADKARRAQLSELNEDVAKHAVDEALDDLLASFSDVPAALDYIRTAGRDLIHNVALFLSSGEEENAIVKRPLDTAHDARFRRYMVNVMVSNGDGPPAGAPVVEELNPTHGNLIGRVEHIAQMGTLVTDFLLIKPGALHRANGGYLLLDVRKVLLSPFAWEALEARHQDPRDPHRAAGRGVGLQHDLDADAGSRAHPARRARGAVRRPRALLHAVRRRSRLLAPVQGAGGLRRQHRPLDRERPRLRQADRLDRQGARPEALRRRRASPA